MMMMIAAVINQMLALTGSVPSLLPCGLTLYSSAVRPGNRGLG